MFPSKFLLGLHCESEVLIPVTPAQDDRLPFGFQLLPSELPNDLKQPIAGIAAPLLLHVNERLIYQVREQFKHRSLFDLIPCANGLCCLQGASAREDTQPTKKGSLLFREQIDYSTRSSLARFAGEAKLFGRGF